jgi:hypothetical protein
MARPFVTHDELLINSIFGKRALDQLSTNDYIDWAGEMLVQGYDTYSLRILAGLDRFASTFEAEDYFLRSIKELDLSIPDRENSIRAYTCEIARQIIGGQLTGQQGVHALYKICIATEYERDFLVWLELDDALDNLLAGAYPFTYESATLENFDELAKREAENFISKVCGQPAT